MATAENRWPEELKARIAGVKGLIKFYDDKLNRVGHLSSNQFESRNKNIDLLEVFQAFQLSEEKRRLLVCVVEWMTMAVYKPLRKGTIFISSISDPFSKLVEIQKRIGFAQTMKELADVSEELAEFKRQHPELEND